MLIDCSWDLHHELSDKFESKFLFDPVYQYIVASNEDFGNILFMKTVQASFDKGLLTKNIRAKT